MDIKEFVKESLRQIVEGVKEVQSEVADKSQIAPIGNQLERVEFDIGVTVDEEETKDKGAGLSVYCLKVGASGQTSASISSAHRIKFCVNIKFESEADQRDREKRDLDEIDDLERKHGMRD